MRRFDTPAAPPGWAGQGAALLRIVDPLGGAIAWLAPALGAACVGYAVRDAAGAWRQLLHTAPPATWRAAPRAYGIAPLDPAPGDDDPAQARPWRFAERDPTAASCALTWTPEDATEDTLSPARLDLTLAARLEDAALHVELAADNVGPVAAPVALGLCLCPAPGFRPDPADPTALRADDGARFLLHFPAAGEFTLAAGAEADGATHLTFRHAGASAGPLAPGARRAVTLRVALREGAERAR